MTNTDEAVIELLARALELYQGMSSEAIHGEVDVVERVCAIEGKRGRDAVQEKVAWLCGRLIYGTA